MAGLLEILGINLSQGALTASAFILGLFGGWCSLLFSNGHPIKNLKLLGIIRNKPSS